MNTQNHGSSQHGAFRANDPLVGKTIGGRYTILRLIGRGGVGLVYLASQVDAAELVVIKVLAPDWAHNREALARFEREVERLGTLHHPNIVRMLDYGHEDGRGYMVMEYVDGVTLGQYIRQRGALELERFVPIAAQILKGIGYAHSRGMIHRDLKPSNLMLCTKNGRGNFIKILDFGLAKLIEGEKQITAQHVVGTAGFLSPEQIKGESLDLRVDVYALGVLFYFILTGKMPFFGENNASLLYKHVHEAPPAISDALPATHGIPDGVTSMVMRALAKAPDKRPADADAMTEILIDCCQASLFHLPRADDPDVAQADGSGVFQNISDTGRFGSTVHIEPPTNMSFDSSAHASLLESSTSFPRVQLVASDPAPESGRSASWWIILGAAVALLLGGVLAYAFSQSSDGERRAVAGGEGLDSAFDHIEELLNAERFTEAQRELERVRAGAEASAASALRYERLNDRAKVGHLLETAKELETVGDVVVARDHYRRVLDLDPANMVARERLAALTTGEGDGESVVAVPVAEDDDDSPAKSSKKSRRVAKTKRASGKPEPTSSEPAPTKKKTANVPPKDGMFLPTPKSDKGGVFLPVGKKP